MNRNPGLPAFLFILVAIFASVLIRSDWRSSFASSKTVAGLIAFIEHGERGVLSGLGNGTIHGLDTESVQTLAARFGARLKNGHDVRPLGNLTKGGQRVTLWKIEFRDGGDDALVTLSLKDSAVTGFSID